jgi:hypothetical protein
MASTRGYPRKLTDQQVELVLASNKRRTAFRASHGTAKDLARRLSVPEYPVLYLIRRARVARSCDPVKWRNLDASARAALLRRHRGSGRHCSLTLEQQIEVLEWHTESLAADAARGSVIQLCRKLGISHPSLRKCILRDGVYKQAYRGDFKFPSRKPKAAVERSSGPRREKVAHRENRMRATLMQQWR